MPNDSDRQEYQAILTYKSRRSYAFVFKAGSDEEAINSANDWYRRNADLYDSPEAVDIYRYVTGEYDWSAGIYLSTQGRHVGCITAGAMTKLKSYLVGMRAERN